ncbi:tissue factor pathway inhibitor 2 [Drosophila teissieri]|uniref:tissue factor pathway inhibitor 2 n=1 Tax=Drosophila teissieri TaxID=7243 RepID=UPI001CB9EB7A|nr:tissue factor pathway inhibitor 2 [Drosophila teissieri]
MKFLFLILAGLTLYVAYINGQICQGRPVFQLCTGGKDEGNRNGRLCGLTAQNGMWFYNSRNRKCEKMNYRGCGGNGNRYCKVEDCNRCRR